MAADHENELLEYLAENPFENFEERYDVQLFQFKASGLEIKMDLDTFDSINYNDSIQFIQNRIEIAGYVRTRERDQVNHTGKIKIINANIKAEETVTHPDSYTIYDTPDNILNQINSGNGSIFSSINAAFGDFPFQDIHNFSRIGWSSVGFDINDYSSFDIRLYVDNTRVSQPNWVIGVLWTSKKLDPFYYYYDRESKSITRKTTAEWKQMSRAYSENGDQEISKYSSFLFNYLFENHLLPERLLDGNRLVKFFSDYENDNLLIVIFGEYSSRPTTAIYLVENYGTICPVNLTWRIAEQKFCNIISDLCFIYNSSFYVKDFDKLFIRSNVTGIVSHDISDYHDFIGSFKQRVEEHKYEDYSWKALAPNGGNAFGMSDVELARLNEFYRSNYPAKLITDLSILRVKDYPDITDFPDININDQIFNENYDFGIVKQVGYSHDGKVYILRIERLLASMDFNDWFNL